MANAEWVNGANRRYIISADDIPELERDAGVQEFINKKPREQAEAEAYDSYRRKHHIQAAAHHLASMKAAAASGSHNDAKKHKLVYDLHVKQLGYNPDDHQVPDEINQLMNDPEKNPGLRFKAHKGDAFLLNKSLAPLSLPVNEWADWEADYPEYNFGKTLSKSELPRFIELRKGDSPLEVNFLTNKLRQLRDHFDQQGATSVNERELDDNMRRQLQALRVPRDYQGNFSRDAIQRTIDAQPKVNYNWSTGTFDRAVGATQRHSSELSNVLRLDITPEIAQKLKDAGVWDTFMNMQHMSRESGHPNTDNTAGWVRWTGDKSGVHLDELQSDFGRPWTAMLAEMGRKQYNIPEEGIPQFLQQHGHLLPEEKRKIIQKILFGNKHPGEVLHEAFAAWARGPGDLTGAPIHIWQPEAKLHIANIDEDPRGHFEPNRPVPGHFQVTYRDVPVKRGYEEGKYGQIPTQSNPKLKRMPPKNKVEVGKVGEDILWHPSNKTYKDTIRGEQETPKPQLPRKTKKSEAPVSLADLKARLAETLKKSLAKGMGTPTPGMSGGQPVMNRIAPAAPPDTSKVKPMSTGALASIQAHNAAQAPKIKEQSKKIALPRPPAKINLQMGEKPYTGRDEGIRRSKLPPGAPGADKAGVGVQVDKKKKADKESARKYRPGKDD